MWFFTIIGKWSVNNGIIKTNNSYNKGPWICYYHHLDHNILDDGVYAVALKALLLNKNNNKLMKSLPASDSVDFLLLLNNVEKSSVNKGRDNFPAHTNEGEKEEQFNNNNDDDSLFDLIQFILMIVKRTMRMMGIHYFCFCLFVIMNARKIKMKE